MDRAEKVRRYRKRKSSYSRYQYVQQAKGKEGVKIRLIGFGAVAVGIAAILFVVLHNRNMGSELAYVSEDEFASLMSFLVDDTAEPTFAEAKSEKESPAMTQGKLRECIQNIGLSEMVPVTGGNGELSREEVMDYYNQILDYLDLDGAVHKKTILNLDQTEDSCQTQNGKLKLKAASIELEPFQAYDVYVMDKVLLGVYGRSNDTISLKDVMVDSVTEDQLFFEYQGKGYQVECSDTQGLSENVHCTLQIKNGKVIKVKEIKGAENAEQSQEVSKDTQIVAKDVRVLLLNQGAVHYSQVCLSCDGDCLVKINKKNNKYKKSEVINADKIKIKTGKYVTVVPQKDSSRLYLTDVNGGAISKGYYGSIEIYKDAEGYYIVNEVNIEKYLYSVVASEMPSYFEPEALKAQAVCARSYVYRQIAAEDYRAYHAQIDDSTNYQVYNRSDISDADVQAVTETAGEVMYAQDEIVSAYYFSASCGYTSGMEIWNQKGLCPYLKARSLTASEKKFDLSKEAAFRKYITSADGDGVFDGSSPYFRWNAKVELSSCLEELKECIQSRQKINPDNIKLYSTTGKKAVKVSSLTGFGGFQKMYCAQRSKSGAVLKLIICFEFGKAEIRSEYNIRSILGCALEKITYADGSENTSVRFLPSAYFSLAFDKNSGRYLLAGGGNGHGMGMSQYAADGMAKEGWDYRKILAFFYDGIMIKKMET